MDHLVFICLDKSMKEMKKIQKLSKPISEHWKSIPLFGLHMKDCANWVKKLMLARYLEISNSKPMRKKDKKSKESVVCNKFR